MPKETKTPSHPHRVSPIDLSHRPPKERTAAIWSNTDDEVLISARASGLNWQPIATRHFPNKTANACRKRHERLMERRHVEDWDSEKLEALAREYMAMRKDMWEILASRVGEKWQVVEAKCMEKGLKTLQSTARTAQRKATADSFSSEDRDHGEQHHDHDSGISLGSDAEMEVGDTVIAGPSSSFTQQQTTSSAAPPRQDTYTTAPAQSRSFRDHERSRSLPQPLPLYRPPLPIAYSTPSTAAMIYQQSATQTAHYFVPPSRRSSGDDSQRGGLSIQAMLSPADSQNV